jgi:hypothetical protein
MRFETARIAVRVTLALCSATLGLAVCTAANAQTDQMLLRGPVDSVNTRTSQIQVLGQWLTVAGSAVSELQGHMVAVDGAIDASGGYLVSNIEDLNSVQYVAGATPVYFSGVIQSVNKSAGSFVVGGVSVDYTAALSSLQPDNLMVGSVASFNAVRFTDVKKMYAAEGVAVANVALGSNAISRPSGVIGSDTAGVIGSDALKRRSGVIGIDTAGVIGSDVLNRSSGVIGSDTAGVIGSDGLKRRSGVIGSDTAGVIGSDVLNW